MKTFFKPVAVAVLVTIWQPGIAGDFAHQVETQSRYYGVGWQSDGNHWSIELLVTGTGAQIAYPSSDCSGTWDLIGTTPDHMEFVERITEGVENCIELGTAYLDPLPDGNLLYSWQEHKASIDARAVLVPVSGARMPYMDLLMLTLKGVRLDYLLPEFYE